MADPVPFPCTGNNRVIVYCLSCGNKTWTMAEVIEARFGCLPFGMLTGKLRCKSGCGDNFGVVLPLDAPDPRAWVRKYGVEPPALPERPRRRVVAPTHAPERPEGEIIEIEGDQVTRVHCIADELPILQHAFDHLLRKSHEAGRTKHFVMRRGATWMRDSKRDFKVVAGKLVECEDDPEGDREIDLEDL
jgi:hypothetical protein